MSNELGASHPRTAKFSLVVAVIVSTAFGMLIAAVLLFFQDEYPVLFVEDEVVRNVVRELTPMLAFCIVINNVQPVLSGNTHQNLSFGLLVFFLLNSNTARMYIKLVTQ